MGSLMTLYPTLKRGAIRLCPFGTYWRRCIDIGRPQKSLCIRNSGEFHYGPTLILSGDKALVITPPFLGGCSIQEVENRLDAQLRSDLLTGTLRSQTWGGWGNTLERPRRQS